MEPGHLVHEWSSKDVEGSSLLPDLCLSRGNTQSPDDPLNDQPHELCTEPANLKDLLM